MVLSNSGGGECGGDGITTVNWRWICCERLVSRSGDDTGCGGLSGLSNSRWRYLVSIKKIIAIINWTTKFKNNSVSFHFHFSINFRTNQSLKIFAPCERIGTNENYIIIHCLNAKQWARRARTSQHEITTKNSSSTPTCIQASDGIKKYIRKRSECN